MTAATSYGVLGTLEVPLVLGLLRLSTEGRPELDEAIKVIHHALDQGIRVLDTADSYGLDHKDLHYGETLVRRALDSWSGPRADVRVITKAGLDRPNRRIDRLRRDSDFMGGPLRFIEPEPETVRHHIDRLIKAAAE